MGIRSFVSNEGADLLSLFLLEGIADSQMETDGILKAWDIVVTFLTRIVREVETEADIDTNHEKCQIVAKADTGAESDAIQEIAHRSHFGQSTARTGRILPQEPNIARIEENGCVEIPEKLASIFHVGFEFEFAHLIQIGILIVGIRIEPSGADATDGESSDTIGTAYIELLAIGCHSHIAIAIDHASSETGCQ